MSSSVESTAQQQPPPPSRPPVSGTFRESFIAHAERPEIAAAIRAFGDVLFDLVCEGDAVLGFPRGEASDVVLDQRFVGGPIGDVRQAAAELADAARAVEDGISGAARARLYLALAAAAPEVAAIAERLDAAFASYLAAVAPDAPQPAAVRQPFAEAAALLAALRSDVTAALASARKRLATFAAGLPDAGDDNALAELQRLTRDMADPETWDSEEVLQLVDSLGALGAADLEQQLRQRAGEVRS